MRKTEYRKHEMVSTGKLGFMMPYRKPYFSGKVAKTFYPYGAELWREYDCFALSLLDGGAFFFSNAHFGAADGKTVLRAWEEGKLLAAWQGADGKVEWDRFWQIWDSTLCLPRFEQHVWLNRLYCLLPLAQAWLRTGEQRYARDWDKIFKEWMSAHPIVPPLQKAHESRSCWHDMQVTTRLIMLLHSVFLLSHGEALPAVSWRRIYRAIRLHANHVFVEAAQAHATKGGIGNHYQQKGTALVATAVLFPEFPEAAKWLATGRSVLEEHAAADILADGANIEASPSYSHFIARLSLDPHLFLIANGCETIPGWEGLLQRQYAYLAQTCDPHGNTLQVSDSYFMSAKADIALVRRLWPELAVTKRSGSNWFDPSKFGLLHQGCFDVAVDAGKTNLWHHHRGKPNILVWYKGEPLLIDTGCPSYDEDVRDRWCKYAAAHNVVTVEPDEEAAKWDELTAMPECKCLYHDDKTIEINHTCNTPSLNYNWRRRISLSDGVCHVRDSVRADRPVRISLHLHLAPVNMTLTANNRCAVIALDCGKARINLLSRGIKFNICDQLAIGTNNHWTRSAHLNVNKPGRTATFEWQIV